jgi:hypothetical protein
VTSALQIATQALFGQADFLSKANGELKSFAASHTRLQTLGHVLAQGGLCFIAALSSTLGYMVDIMVPATLSILMGAALTASFVGLIILLSTHDPIGNLARFGSTLGYVCSTPFQLLSECCLKRTHIDDEAREKRHDQLQLARREISEVSAGIGAVIGLIGGLALRMFATH